MDENRFILLPARGLKGSGASTASQRQFFLLANGAFSAAGARMQLAGKAPTAPSLRVIDSIHEDGAKLVEIAPDALSALRVAQPGLRIVPIRYYEPARAHRMTIVSAAANAVRPAVAAAPWVLTVVDRVSKKRLPGVQIVAFTNFATRAGAQGTSDAQGLCMLSFDSRPAAVERLYVYPPGGYWSALRETVPTGAPYTVDLQPVALTDADGLQHYYPAAADEDGKGVRIGIVDTGVALAHPDLVVEGGMNAVVGEDPQDFGDNGEEGHGTHVAGITAARGKRPTGMRGLAPGATLRSYRVFGKGQGRASNYSIAKAIDRAVADGCDLLNLSLGGSADDEAIRAAVDDAQAQGTVVIAAAGNDGRQPVSFPAADPHAIAVTALGRLGTFPKDTVDMGDVGAPFGTDPNDYVALFSNFGPPVDLIAPGVAIVSTLPPSIYGVLSGTSMACPAATGFAARLLSRNPALLSSTRDAARAEAIMTAVLQASVTLGFKPEYEGRGLPR